MKIYTILRGMFMSKFLSDFSFKESQYSYYDIERVVTS